MVLADSRRVSRVPRYSGTMSRNVRAVSVTGLSPSMAGINPGLFTYGRTQPGGTAVPPNTAPQHRPCNACRLTHRRFGLFPLRSPLLGESHLLSFPGGTEMFHFSPLASSPYVFRRRYPGSTPGWVSPFGNLRITACLAAPRSFSQLTTPFIAS
jgi:hypothetical protein